MIIPTIAVNKIYNFIIFKIARLRSFFWGIFLKKLGKRVSILSGVIIMSPQNVDIGNDVLITNDVKIGGQNGVTIGHDTIIGFNVNIVTANYSYQSKNLPIKKQGYMGGAVTIGNDVWIGANAVILPKTKVGNGAIIGANAVVTKDVPPYTVVGGVPVKIIKKRYEKKRL